MWLPFAKLVSPAGLLDGTVILKSNRDHKEAFGNWNVLKPSQLYHSNTAIGRKFILFYRGFVAGGDDVLVSPWITFGSVSEKLCLFEINSIGREVSSVEHARDLHGVT